MTKFKKIISFREINKTPQIFFSETSKILRSYSGRWLPGLISTNKNIFKFGNKVTNNIDSAQPASKIPLIFAVCSLSVAMFGTTREHLGNILKEKIFLKVLDGKVVFVLKVYDLRITNVDLLANSSNHVMFPEYSRNIPWMSVSIIFQGYPRNIVKLWKYFSKSKSSKKLFCEFSCENFNIGSLLSCNVFLNFIETVLHLE